MKKTQVKMISALAMCISMLPLICLADESYKSAMFDFSEQQLAAKLGEQTPVSITGGNAVVYCESEIQVSGEAKRTSCYDKANNNDLVASTEQAIESLTFTPAEVNGEKVPVKMTYRVGVSNVESKIAVVLIPNLGTMQERYGRDYIAPQERLDVSSWYDRYNERSWVNGKAFLGDGPMSRVAATVDEKGKTDVVREVGTERAYKRDASIVKHALRRSRFIPGFVDGRPVPMGYLAVVNYGEESGEAVSTR